jgi:hypothetical protein
VECICQFVNSAVSHKPVLGKTAKLIFKTQPCHRSGS